MIRINLLAVERERKKAKGTFQVAQKLTIGCSLILVLALLFMGWRYWSLGAQSKQLDDEIAAAQKEASRLHTIILQVQTFEQRKADLTQRVTLIQQLRKEPTAPAQPLYKVNRTL